MSDTNAINLADSLATHLIATLEESKVKAAANTAEGALARGRIFQSTGYFAEAAESYLGALSQDVQLDEASARLVTVEIMRGRIDSALAHAMKLAARNPKFEFKEVSSDQVVSAMTLLGDALAADGRTKDAIEAYKAARVSNPMDTFAAGRLAQLYLATGEPKYAQQQAKEIGGNTRFAELSRMLALGAKSDAFLPSFRLDGLAGVLRVSMPGRPMVIDNDARVASIVHGCDCWCADVFPDILA